MAKSSNRHHEPPPQTLVASGPRQREEIPAKYRWDLGRLFRDWSEWQAEYAAVEALLPQCQRFQGKLANGPEAVLGAYRLEDELGRRIGLLYRYPQLLRDTDTRNNEATARVQEVQSLVTRQSTSTSWLEPEMLAIPRETMARWIDETPDLAPYRHAILELYRKQEHVLDEAQEKLLSLSGPFRQTPSTTYRELCSSDVRFQTVTLSDGRETTISHGKYSALLQTARKQEDRTKAFRALYDVYVANLNTYAAIYHGVLQRDWFLAQARRYPSCLAASLDGKNVPPEVFHTLVGTARRGSAEVQRYLGLRKRLLGLDRYYLYDGQVPIIESSASYPFDEMEELILESVAPLGVEYQTRMRQRFEGGWIDVYENEGKRSGAYSAGVYGHGPYVLLNYNETLHDAFTLAHELGHAMHTVLSYESQPHATANYTIFVAEVASTLNEALLLETLLRRTQSPRERAAFLQRQIDAILSTFFAQVLFADFEYRTHTLVEQGRPITANTLNELYSTLLREYYGEAVDEEPRYRATWARIAHFFESPFYVYQYATCFASSAKLYRDLTEGDAASRAAAVERYLGLLRSGGNDYPMEQLRRAGVDLTEPGTIQAVIDELDRLVTRFEAEMSKI